MDVTDTENVVRAFYSALARGDVTTALAHLDPAIEWEEAEKSPYYAGVVTGVEAVVRTVLDPIARDYDDFACTPSDFVTQGARTASFGLYTGRARAGGGTLSAPFVHLWTVRRGLIKRFLQHTDSAAWSEAAGLGRRSARARPPAVPPS